MDFKEMGINTRNLVDKAQDMDYWRALVNSAFNLQVREAIELVSDSGLYNRLKIQSKVLTNTTILTLPT